MALMVFSDSEVYNDKTYTKTCLKNYETLKKQCDDLIVKLNKTEFTAPTYKRGLTTVEDQLITYRKNEVLFSKEVAVLKREVACKDYEINVLKSEFEKVKREKEGIEFKIKNFDNALKRLNKLLESQITDKRKKGLGYNIVPLPHPLIYNRPKKIDLSYSGLDEFKDPEFKSYGFEDSKQESNIVCDKKSDDSKENSNDSLVKEQVSEDTSSFVKSSLNVDKKPFKKSVRLIVNTIKGKGCGCSRHMTGNIAYLSDFKEFDGGYVTFGGGAHGGRISSKGTHKTDSLDFKDVYFVNELNFNLFSVSHMCDKKNCVLFNDTKCLVLSPNFKLLDESQILLKIPRKDNMYSFDMKKIVPKESLTCLVAKATSDESHETSTARIPEQNGVVKRRNHTLVEAARTMLSATKVPLFFWAEAIATVCFIQNRSLVILRHEKTPYHIINARKPSVKFFHIFGSLCYIVRDGENLDKMEEKGDACIFVGYSTQSKAYTVFNKRTRMIVETIHVNFDELPQMASDHVSSDPGPQCSTMVLEQDSLSLGLQSQENVPQIAEIVTTSNELELLYSSMFSELLNGISPVVSKLSHLVRLRQHLSGLTDAGYSVKSAAHIYDFVATTYQHKTGETLE
ncbi:retrovirus-related pol polyprotein from transposon TNT 1-94 [Tanacetum coccineum]|uniref:Retrovirus-related pol polyprotein from transposon TNT 1-94 n=1 Tax=Tanacetum coccineum TaxID=301880 RepID=A0ABQ5A9V1_9ASTR